MEFVDTHTHISDDAFAGEVEAVVRRALDAGVVQMLQADTCSAERTAMYELCDAYHLPLLIHTGDYRYDFSNVNRLIPILETFPHLQVIGAHFGGWSLWAQAAEALYKFDNLAVDSSSTFHWVSRDTAKKLFALYGTDRVLFGSDFPMWDPKDEIEYLLTLGLSDEELEKVFYKNAQKMFEITL